MNKILLSIIVISSLLFYGGCGKQEDKKQIKNDSTKKIQEFKLITKGKIEKRIISQEKNSKAEKLTLDLYNLTNSLNEFDFELKANVIAQKIWDIPYDERKSMNILNPLFVEQFTNIIKNAKAILKFSKPLSVGLASDKDMLALINILLYAETQSDNSLEKSDINSLVAFMYDRMLDFDTELIYNKKQYNYAKQSGNQKAIIKACGDLSLNLSNLDKKSEALKLCDEISNVAPDYSEYYKCQCLSLGPKEINNTIKKYEILLKRKDLCNDVRNMAEADLRMLKVNRIKNN